MQISKGFGAIICLFFIVSLALAQQAWRVGDQVEAKHTTNWYKATILEVRNGWYKVHYDDYDNAYDQWKAAADIRPRANAANPNNALATGNAVQVGSWVLANLGTPNWAAATVLEIKQGQYKVRFHNDAKDAYYLVPLNRIRPMPATSIPATDASFFFGKWDLSIWGGVQTVERGGKVVREFDYAAAKVPPLTIKGDGTYEWIVLANGGRKVIAGRWRNVTAAEWRYDSFAIVLLTGESGKNWILRENITFCTPKFVGERDSLCTPDKVRDKIKLWDGDINYDGTKTR